ncbi:MAG: ABC transporter permease [Flavobacteriaceae bacterium]|nr:ABC transporter permease [Flavobacteriaceae bacterium]
MFRHFDLVLFVAKRMRQHGGNKGNVSNKIVTIATIAVAIGMMMILIAIATGKGMQKEIQQKVVAFNGHLTVGHIENEEQSISTIPLTNQVSVRQYLDSQKEITEFHPYAAISGMLKTAEDFEGVILKGVDSTYNWSLLNDFLVKGDFPSLKNHHSNEILISQKIASRLQLNLQDQVDAVFISHQLQQYPNRRKFTISGIYNSGFPEIDNHLIMGGIGHIQAINRWAENEIGGYQILIDDFSQADAIAQKLYQELPIEMTTVSLLSRYGLIFQWISLFDFNILIILMIMIIVGVMNMSTALLALVFERTAMIGLLKALGGTNYLIQRIFLINGVLVMFRGLLVGNALALLFYLTQKQWSWIRLNPETYFVSSAPVHLTLWQVLGVNTLFLVVCALLLWFPTFMVMRIAPAKTLRVT